VGAEEDRERQQRAEEGRALFAAYQASVQQLATGMLAVGERLEHSNQLQAKIVQQNDAIIRGQQSLIEHLAALQRQIAVDVQMRGQAAGIPIQNGVPPQPQTLL